MNKHFILIVVFILFSCSKEDNFSSKSKFARVEETRFINIIRLPEKFNKLQINISGILNYEFENVSLYQNRWDKFRDKKEKAIWLELQNNIDLKKLECLNGKRISIIGTFNSKDKGHLNQYCGTLEEIIFLNQQ